MTQLVANDEHCQYYSTITEPCQVLCQEKAHEFVEKVPNQ